MSSPIPTALAAARTSPLVGTCRKSSTTTTSSCPSSRIRQRRRRRRTTRYASLMILLVACFSSSSLPSLQALIQPPQSQLHRHTTTQKSVPSSSTPVEPKRRRQEHSDRLQPPPFSPPPDNPNDRSHNHNNNDPSLKRSGTMSRRTAFAGLSLWTGAALLPLAAHAQTTQDPLTASLQLGDGQWMPLDRKQQYTTTSTLNASSLPPAAFWTYAARFLLVYDSGVAAWWQGLEDQFELLPEETRQERLGQQFGRLAKTVQTAVLTMVQEDNSDNYQPLWDLFWDRYASLPDAPRQLTLLFSLLEPNQQPVSQIKSVLSKQARFEDAPQDNASADMTRVVPGWTSLLPDSYGLVYSTVDRSYTLSPPLPPLSTLTIDQNPNTEESTVFGPLAATPLTREKPQFDLSTYALFGLSGATGCALTHSLVIPLDVVKTRAQTDSIVDQNKKNNNLVAAAQQIVRQEGVSGLFLGAQATLAGYFWYGLSVYPSYTFFKRLVGQTILSPATATVHANDVALIAGALAAVVASVGLTPLEAARIRVVAEPQTYRPLGLVGTCRAIAQEAAPETTSQTRLTFNFKALYAGFPSLLTRQVIFGSVKFLAFERACEFAYHQWPGLQEQTWTALAVSFGAGIWSGCLSSVVSQPADSILTYVAKNAEGSGNLMEGSRKMVREQGWGSLFRGLGSRCVWAGSIIAGQFLLYDVFRNYLGVSADDLSQVYQVVLSE